MRPVRGAAACAGRRHEQVRRNPVERAGTCDGQPARELQLGGGDRDSVQRRQQRHAGSAGAGRALEPLDRGAQALRTQLEVGLVLEHILQEHAQGGAPPPAPSRAPRIRARAGEIALESREGLQRSYRLGVAGQATQRRLALGDERAGQGSVAVQRCRAHPAAQPLRVHLEGHLRAPRHLAAQVARGRLQVLGERRLELARAHSAHFRARAERSCRTQRCLHARGRQTRRRALLAWPVRQPRGRRRKKGSRRTRRTPLQRPATARRTRACRR